MTDISHLTRHWMRQTEIGRGVRLSADDLDLLNAIGVGELIEMASHENVPDPILPPTCPSCDPFIYFMQSVDGGPVKIGLTRSPKNRRTEHQTSSPAEFRFIALFRAPAPFEKALHVHFLPEWVRGEWHHPSARLLRFCHKVGVA